MKRALLKIWTLLITSNVADSARRVVRKRFARKYWVPVLLSGSIFGMLLAFIAVLSGEAFLPSLSWYGGFAILFMAAVWPLMQGIYLFATAPREAAMDMVKKRSVFLSTLLFIALALLGFLTSLAPNQGMSNAGSLLIPFVTAGLIGLVGMLSFFIGIQVYALNENVDSVGKQIEETARILRTTVAHSAKELQTAATDVTTKLDKIDKAGVEISAASLHAIGHAIRLEKFFAEDLAQEVAPSQGYRVHEAIDALGLNFAKWLEHLQGAKKVNDGIVQRLWWQWLTTYYREEAFDIAGGVTVTNGRNACLLILGSIHAFLQQAAHEKTQPEIAFVTPLHPKDWFNPPRPVAEKACLESWFIGLYHRSLSQIIHGSPGAEEATTQPELKPIIRRYILSLNRDAQQARALRNRTKAVFGWHLEASKELGAGLIDYQIIDVAVPLNKSIRFDELCADCRSLVRIYELFAKRSGEIQVPETHWHFVPLWNPAWKDEINQIADKDSDLCDLLKQHPRDGCSKPECVRTFVAIAKQSATDAFEAANLAVIQACDGNSDELDQVRGRLENEHGSGAKFWETVSLLQRVDARRGAGRGDHVLEQWMISKLRLDAVNRAEIGGVSSWSNLGEVFRNRYHTSEDLAEYVALNDDDVSNWEAHRTGEESRLEGDFILFGLRSRNGNTDWKWAIATELQEPFATAKMTVTADASKLRKYTNTLEWIKKRGLNGQVGKLGFALDGNTK